MYIRNISVHPVYAILFIAVFAGYSTFAQTKVIGKVMKQQNDPLENANVLLLHAKDSALIKGTISDKDGHYLFQNIRPGNYLVSFSSTGFRQAYTVSFSLKEAGQNKNMGEIVLTRSVVDLKGVTVVARKPLFEQKADRMIINVSESITYAGGSALEVLERSPGVQVDQQNNNIVINGKEGVVVMINNKINRMPASAVVQMLAGMSANSIERIELITSPPANFDAEGNAGYINIIMKSSTETGTNGSYAVTAGFSRGENTQGTANLNHRKGKLNSFGDLSFSRIRSAQVWDVYKKVIYQGKTKESYLDISRPALQLFFNGKMGADYTLNNKTLVGILISGYSNQQERYWNNHAYLFTDQQLDTSVVISNKEINDWTNVSANINLQHSLSKDEKININLNYDYYLSNNPVDYNYEYYGDGNNFIHDQIMRSLKRTPINIWVAAVDYTKKLTGKVNMEAGFKETLSGFVNDTETNSLVQNTWQKDETFSSIFDLDENILAAYVAFSIEAGAKTSIKTGVRYEHTISNLGSDKKRDLLVRRYGNVFPTLYITHAFDDQNKLNFSYSKRITRPTFNNLAPTTIFIDPNTYFYGNPALQPSIGNTFTGSYSYRRKIISMSFGYDLKTITNYVPKIDAATNIQSLAAENQKSQVTFTTGLILPFNITKWWTGQFNISATFQKLNAYFKGDEIKLKQQYIIAGFSQTFLLPGNFSMETSGSFNSGGFFGFYIRKPYGTVNAGIQKKFPRHRSGLRLNATNMLNTQVSNVYVNMPGYNIVNRYKMYAVFAAYRLTYTHNFGNDKLRQTRKRTTGAEDVKQRVE